MGWYANNCGCNEMAQFGSFGGHVAQDAQATAAYEFDGELAQASPSASTRW